MSTRKNRERTVERVKNPGGPKGNLYIAMDIGTTKVCTVVARIGNNGEMEVIRTGVERSVGMHKALVVDMESLREAVRSSWTKAVKGLGRNLPGACIGVTGSHILSRRTTAFLDGLDDPAERVITRQDVQQVVKLSYPQVTDQQELLHVIPISYTVDSAEGVRNPVGLEGHRLSVESHAIIGEAASLDNVVRAVEGAGVPVGSMVLEPLASAEAVLTGDEREMGVVLVDIGGGTSDIAIFKYGVMVHTAVVPVAGFQFTNDLALALGIPYDAAEAIKIKYGHALPDQVKPDDIVPLPVRQGEKPRGIRHRDFCNLLNDRAVELLRLIRLEIKRAGLDTMPPGGIVFTGGGANLPGWEQLTREYLPGPVRISPPRDILGLPQELKRAQFSTSIGILLWGLYHPVEQQEYKEQETAATAGSGFLKGKHWLQWLAQFVGARKAYT